MAITTEPLIFLILLFAIGIAVALFVGAGGAYFASKKFNNLVLKRILAFVLLLASIKLLMT